MNKSAAIKTFAMTNMLIEADLYKIEQKYQIDLGRGSSQPTKIEATYFSQFDTELKAEAKRMARHYEVFYCLEKSIRQLIIDVFESNGDEEWWNNLVPKEVKDNVKKSIKRDKEAAVTPRSTDPIDYTTFGELGEIIKSNWSIFGGAIFNERKALEKVMSALNSLRNPIAHCSPLAEDEVLRLDLTLRDWFRLIS